MARSSNNCRSLELYDGNNHQIVHDSPATIFGHRSRCDFCDVTFSSDLDCSRHLNGSAHSKAIDEFVSLHNFQDTIVEKSIPKNLREIFNSIKVRTPRDIAELADKGYFKIIDETGYEIAEEMAKILFNHSIVEFQSKELPLESRAVLSQAMEVHREQAEKEWPTSARATSQSQPPVQQIVPESRASTSRAAQPSTSSSSRTKSVKSSEKPSQPAPIAENSAPIKPSTTKRPLSSNQSPPKKVPKAKRSAPLPPLPNSRPPNLPKVNLPSPNLPRPNLPTLNLPRPNLPVPNLPRPNLPAPNLPLPRPNPQNDYIPVLAKIKIEPVSQDNE